MNARSRSLCRRSRPSATAKLTNRRRRTCRGQCAARSRRGEAATIAGVYETFVRTAGIAKENVAQGNLLRILTAGDDVEDEDEDIGDAEAIDDCDPQAAPADGGRRDNSSKGPYST